MAGRRKREPLVETREERWAREDQELRLQCLFPERVGVGEWPPWWGRFRELRVPFELVDEVDDVIEQHDEMPATLVVRGVGERLWDLHDAIVDNGRPFRRHYRNLPPDEARDLSASLFAHTERALRAGVTATLTLQQWRAIGSALAWRCTYCEESNAVTIDHIVPISRGGGHMVGNVVPACKRCNSKKHAQNIDDWLDVEGRDARAIYARIAVAERAGLAA